MGSAFAIKDLEIPSVGLYGACSTMALSMCVGSMLVDGGANYVVAGTSSHFCLRLKGSFDFRLNMEVKDRPVHSGQ